MKKEKLKIKLTDAVNAGKDKDGNVSQIPIFESIEMIDGELYGVIEGYADASKHLLEDTNSLLH